MEVQRHSFFTLASYCDEWSFSVFKGLITFCNHDFKVNSFARHELEIFLFDTECSCFFTLINEGAYYCKEGYIMYFTEIYFVSLKYWVTVENTVTITDLFPW